MLTFCCGNATILPMVCIKVAYLNTFYFQITDVVGFAESVGRVLEASRVSVAWIPVGICLSALEKTIEYVKKREAFGAPLASNQLIQG